jgi:hypothetical protein
MDCTNRKIALALTTGALVLVFLLSSCPGLLQDPPTGLQATAVSTTSISVTWNPLQLAESYRLYWGTSSFPIDNVVASEEPSVLLTGLQPSQGYYFRVTGVNYAGESPYSWDTACNTLSLPLPAPEIISCRQISFQAVELKWKPLTGHESYLVRYSLDGQSTRYSVSVGSSTSYTQEGLGAPSTYIFGVAASGNDLNEWAEATVTMH